MILLALMSALLNQAFAAPTEPDWSEGVQIPVSGRANPYQLPEDELSQAVRRGRVHALQYPVSMTGLLLPKEAVQNLYADANSPLRKFIGSIFGGFADMRSEDDLFAWVGLQEFPSDEGQGPYFVPFPEGHRPGYRMGFGLIPRDGVDGITLSCASCHAGNLFGRKIIGMSNRFPRANDTFINAKKGMAQLDPSLFHLLSNSTPGDQSLYVETRAKMRRVGVRAPQVLGLDTSLAQVALSLARRNPDDYATPNSKYETHPRPEPLARFVADSKPAVWWNVKFKNRWLSDGSVVSGNPIYTNFLWNEIGRGTDLHDLDAWLQSSASTIRELTTAVFNSEAPRFTDYFAAEMLPLGRAQRGEAVFKARCERCHGVYEKDWSQADPLKTLSVAYPSNTPVVNVGTDPSRFEGMLSLEQGLNRLSISQREQIVIRTQKGYVPPPLVGIWARWPYFHNNSVPTLCALLTRHEDRPRQYFAGEALDPGSDFDRECNGYPTGGNVPQAWTRNRETFYNTTRPGLSNSGHDEGIFLEQGRELLTPTQKSDLIVFLQTL